MYSSPVPPVLPVLPVWQVLRVLPVLGFALAALPSPAAGQTASAPGAAVAAPAPTRRTWVIEVAHSELTFRVRHLVSRANGTFRKWSGVISADPGRWNEGSVDVTIDAATIDTRHERRDNHLRSEEFFDVANHPTITFRSTSVDIAGSQLRLTGDLTIRGIARPVVLEGEILGAQGNRAGFSATTKVNRLDYGLQWNRAVEGGGLVLGDEVEISLVVAAVLTDRPPASPPSSQPASPSGG
ncbi:MAG: YceI family protein [Gemmatimonadales bacterium]